MCVCVCVCVCVCMYYVRALHMCSSYNQCTYAAHKEGVPDEEDGRVVPHQVPVAVLGVELDRKAPGVPRCVSTATLTTCMQCSSME